MCIDVIVDDIHLLVFVWHCLFLALFWQCVIKFVHLVILSYRWLMALYCICHRIVTIYISTRSKLVDEVQSKKSQIQFVYDRNIYAWYTVVYSRTWSSNASSLCADRSSVGEFLMKYMSSPDHMLMETSKIVRQLVNIEIWSQNPLNSTGVYGIFYF